MPTNPIPAADSGLSRRTAARRQRSRCRRAATSCTSASGSPARSSGCSCARSRRAKSLRLPRAARASRAASATARFPPGRFPSTSTPAANSSRARSGEGRTDSIQPGTASRLEVKNRTAPVPSTTAGQLSAGRFWALFLGLFVITALPVLHVVLPPFVDYPNHLARMHVLIEQPRSEALQRYYEIRWRPLPNLAMDLVVPMLARVMTLDWAGKVFILMYLALLPGGTALLHRVATGRWSVWPLFAFLFLYTHVLIWGFPNYLFGLGLALPAFALWLALAKRMAALRTGVASAGALVIFFAHLEACA